MTGRLNSNINSVYMSIPISQFTLPTLFSLNIHIFVLYIYVSISALQIRSSIHFSRFHISVLGIIFVFLFLTSLCTTVLTSIHIYVDGTLSFLLMAEWYSTVFLFHIFFIHSVDGHLGCFHVLAILNCAVTNTGVYLSFQVMVF